MRRVSDDFAEQVTALLLGDVMVPPKLKLDLLLLFVHRMTFWAIGEDGLASLIAAGTHVIVAFQTAKFP